MDAKEQNSVSVDTIKCVSFSGLNVKELSYSTARAVKNFIKTKCISHDIDVVFFEPVLIADKVAPLIGFGYHQSEENLIAFFADDTTEIITSSKCSAGLLEAVNTMFAAGTPMLPAQIKSDILGVKTDFLQGYLSEEKAEDPDYFAYKKQKRNIMENHVTAMLNLNAVKFIQERTKQDNRFDIKPLVVKVDDKEVVIVSLGHLNQGDVELYAFAHDGRYFNLDTDDGATDANIINAINKYCEEQNVAEDKNDSVVEAMNAPNIDEILNNDSFNKLLSCFDRNQTRGRWVFSTVDGGASYLFDVMKDQTDVGVVFLSITFTVGKRSTTTNVTAMNCREDSWFYGILTHEDAERHGSTKSN